MSELWLPHVACFLDVTYGLLFPDIVDVAVLVVVAMVVILLLLLSLAAVAGHSDCQRAGGHWGIVYDVRVVRLGLANWSRCL